VEKKKKKDMKTLKGERPAAAVNRAEAVRTNRLAGRLRSFDKQLTDMKVVNQVYNKIFRGSPPLKINKINMAWFDPITDRQTDRQT
jgi:hypothetical protein